MWKSPQVFLTVPAFIKNHKFETQDRQLVGSPINLKYNLGAFSTYLYRGNILILSGKNRTWVASHKLFWGFFPSLYKNIFSKVFTHLESAMPCSLYCNIDFILPIHAGPSCWRSDSATLCLALGAFWNFGGVFKVSSILHAWKLNKIWRTTISATGLDLPRRLRTWL